MTTLQPASVNALHSLALTSEIAFSTAALPDFAMTDVHWSKHELDTPIEMQSASVLHPKFAMMTERTLSLACLACELQSLTLELLGSGEVPHAAAA